MRHGEKISFAQFHPGDPGFLDPLACSNPSTAVVTTVKTRDRIPDEAGVLHVRYAIDKFEHQYRQESGAPIIDIAKRAMCRKMADSLMEFCEIRKVEDRYSESVVYELKIALADLGRLSHVADEAAWSGHQKGRREVLATLPVRVDDFGNVIPR